MNKVITQNLTSEPRQTDVAPLSPTVIDIEASGFGAHSYPIEIGVVRGDGVRYCALIKPAKDWSHWDDSAEALHGIKRSTLFSLGKQACTVCDELNDFLRDEEVYSDAWVHDERWLLALFHSCNKHPKFSMKAIEFIMHESQYGIWDDVKAQVHLQLKLERHRASSDAFLIQQTYIQSRFRC